MTRPKALVQTFVPLATTFPSQSNLISPFITSFASCLVFVVWDESHCARAIDSSAGI